MIPFDGGRILRLVLSKIMGERFSFNFVLTLSITGLVVISLFSYFYRSLGLFLIDLYLFKRIIVELQVFHQWKLWNNVICHTNMIHYEKI